MRILVTGGLGFIGSNFIRHTLATHPGDEVVNLDLATYAANPDNLADVEQRWPGRYTFTQGDVCDAAAVAGLTAEADAVVHFAAESHVDRSIAGPAEFVRTNVLGSQVMLEAARRAWGGDQDRRFVMVSTDEVYGALALDDPRCFDEAWPLDPRSPYSASKAAADHLARAYHHTYGLPVLVTRCSNNYGPRQFPEKLIPLMILNTLEGRELPVYGDGLYVRDWIYVADNCAAHDAVLRRGRPGQAYNIGAGNQRPNLEVVREIVRLVCRAAGLEEAQRLGLIRHVGDRPGHDRRYAIDSAKARRELGWRPEVEFGQGLARTVQWYLEHGEWLARVASGAYREYCQAMYEGR